MSKELATKEENEARIAAFKMVAGSYGGIDEVPEPLRDALKQEWSRVILDENYRASMKDKAEKVAKMEAQGITFS